MVDHRGGIVQLTQANLEKCGWLFSPSLQLMVREHECGNGKWDVEVDHYRNAGVKDDPRWENDQQFFAAAATLADLIRVEGNYLTATRDWVHGDNVEFF